MENQASFIQSTFKTEQRFNTYTLYKFKGQAVQKQQLGNLQASKQYATTPQYENKINGHDVQMKHNKA